ncbi:hypothetical protein LEP1GSC116_1839 [Leptospira interrogans serovar Icterohaemorrhagiae str. Verdun HP]|nr:hypothetical protein LEP1GSC037_3494 [Leptospira interrogans str. 2006001854]EMO06030.1 hypothetical protein LEP1GSC116_1839 [Leptospira interrogans serovar Icterohaemorrhagiae str. Verdun HP]EMY24010.1 hypothetical protein LEP1GSC115_1573 [Leptospira interrogans serovar Australis str. 200703203]
MIFFFVFLATWIGKKEELYGAFSRFRENLPLVLFAFISVLGFIIAVVLTAESKPFLYFVF